MIYTTKELTYLDIIQIIPEETIAKYYLGITPNKPFKSYFRKDPKPSARLYYNKQGFLQYNDFEVHMSLPYLLMCLLNKSYTELLYTIVGNFDIKTTQILAIQKTPLKQNKNSIKTKYNKNDTIIEITTRDWEQKDIDYWGQGGINIEYLSDPRVNVVPINWYWVNGQLYKAAELSYCYNFYWNLNVYRRKIYQPLNSIENRKWTSNINTTVLQGVETLPKNGDLLIISSSFKDSMTIECNTINAKNFIPSCSPNNEMANLPTHIPFKFSKRFNKIITWLDQDEGGHKAAKKYKQLYGYDSIFIPEKFKCKDPFEFRSKYGHIEFIKLLNRLLYE